MPQFPCWMAVLFAFCAIARAHFLFVRICPPAEGGRAAEVYFSELAAAGDPTFIEKVAGAKFWMQTVPGEFQRLELHKLSDRLRAHVPASGTLVVAGQLDYGVLARPNATPFLLRHYSKAAAGNAAELNRMAPKGTNLEIVPTFEPDRVVMTVLLNGKPLPGATFNWIDSGLAGDKVQADAEGRVVFTPPAAGIYSIYTSRRDRTSGEHQGTSYKEVREFATLAFAWPLESRGADAEAVKLFEDAIAARAAWHDFPGFKAKIAGDILDRPFDGTVTVAANGGVQLELSDSGALEWVQDQLESITMHRASQTFSSERPKPVLRLADDRAEHPLGRLLIFEGGEFATSYRVRDRQITTVNRILDGQDMTITVLDNVQNAEGKFLPRSYTVQYWNEPTGRLVRTEAVQDGWIRVGRWDLPEGHTVTTSSETGFEVRNFRLSDHKLGGDSSN